MIYPRHLNHKHEWGQATGQVIVYRGLKTIYWQVNGHGRSRIDGRLQLVTRGLLEFLLSNSSKSVVYPPLALARLAGFHAPFPHPTCLFSQTYFYALRSARNIEPGDRLPTPQIPQVHVQQPTSQLPQVPVDSPNP